MNNIKIALCFFLMTAICLPGSANENPARSTRKIMNSYRGEKGFFAFSVPVFMAKIALSGEDQEVKDMLRDVRRIRILVCGEANRNAGTVNDCIRDFTAFFHASHYVDLVEVRDKSDRVEIKAIPGDDCFHDPVLIVHDGHEFVVIQLLGSVDLEEIGDLISETCLPAGRSEQ